MQPPTPAQPSTPAQLSTPTPPSLQLSHRFKRHLDLDDSLRPTKQQIVQALLGDWEQPLYRRDFECENLDINREILKVNQEMLKRLVAMQEEISHIHSIVR
jgi:hypothetical protein